MAKEADNGGLTSISIQNSSKKLSTHQVAVADAVDFCLDSFFEREKLPYWSRDHAVEMGQDSVGGGTLGTASLPITKIGGSISGCVLLSAVTQNQPLAVTKTSHFEMGDVDAPDRERPWQTYSKWPYWIRYEHFIETDGPGDGLRVSLG